MKKLTFTLCCNDWLEENNDIVTLISLKLKLIFIQTLKNSNTSDMSLKGFESSFIVDGNFA